MKQAFLIIAHNEFKVLKALISILDHHDIDIYVHFDKKVSQLPKLFTKYSKLTILENRIDVRWGHVSQIECEYAIFEEVEKKGIVYDRYHLISGTHLPLKTLDELFNVFKSWGNQEVMSFIYTNSYEVNMKLGRYHFFLRNYKSNNLFFMKTVQFLWNVFIKIQYKLGISRIGPEVTIKANNWVSLTHDALKHIISKKECVLKRFKWTFCGDEFFIPYILENSKDRFVILNYPNLVFNDFYNASPRILTSNDFDFLIQSDYLFGRKFSEIENDVVDKIVHNLKNS